MREMTRSALVARLTRGALPAGGGRRALPELRSRLHLGRGARARRATSGGAPGRAPRPAAHASSPRAIELDPGRSVHMQLVDGPFQVLEGHWSFTPVGKQWLPDRLLAAFPVLQCAEIGPVRLRCSRRAAGLAGACLRRPGAEHAGVRSRRPGERCPRIGGKVAVCPSAVPLLVTHRTAFSVRAGTAR